MREAPRHALAGEPHGRTHKLPACFEANGIAATIGRMFSSGNVFFGCLICLLSIVFPLTKLCLSWYRTLPEAQYHEMAMELFKKIEKWSMADVFVVAVILSCFAIDGDELTDATIGLGVYFVPPILS